MSRWRSVVMSSSLAFAIAMPGRADAPPKRYVVQDDGTVYDTVTRLTWQREVDEHVFALREALSYCQDLALAGGGFRLPTRGELLSLVDPAELRPAIDSQAFPRTPNTWFWTASLWMAATDARWVVSFEDGNTDYFGWLRPFRVRCVR